MADIERDGSNGHFGDLTELAAFVERMISVAQNAGMAAISIETEGLKLKLKSGAGLEASVPGNPLKAESAAAPPTLVSSAEPTGHVVTAPMVGTFYHATSPSDPPLVRVGDRVELGQLIGIIEAMKIMNEITADQSGTVLEVIAANATAVEYGSPLIRLGP